MSFMKKNLVNPTEIKWHRAYDHKVLGTTGLSNVINTNYKSGGCRRLRYLNIAIFYTFSLDRDENGALEHFLIIIWTY